jgi:hypothetical protein
MEAFLVDMLLSLCSDVFEHGPGLQPSHLQEFLSLTKISQEIYEFRLTGTTDLKPLMKLYIQIFLPKRQKTLVFFKINIYPV